VRYCSTQEEGDDTLLSATGTGGGGEGGTPQVVYDVLYEDGIVEEGVPPDCVEPTAAPVHGAPGASAGAGSTADIAATNFDGFFDLAVRAITSGKQFNMLDAAKQAQFAECVQQSRPHFERELRELAHERGFGTTVTAGDIQAILPKILPRVVEDFRKLAA